MITMILRRYLKQSCARVTVKCTNCRQCLILGAWHANHALDRRVLWLAAVVKRSNAVGKVPPVGDEICQVNAARAQEADGGRVDVGVAEDAHDRNLAHLHGGHVQQRVAWGTAHQQHTPSGTRQREGALGGTRVAGTLKDNVSAARFSLAPNGIAQLVGRDIECNNLPRSSQRLGNL